MKRPLSVQHSKPSFGEFYMTKNISQIPKVTNYVVDGSGRDSYINFTNGGNIKASSDNSSCKYQNKISCLNHFSTKNYNVISKIAIYRSDGFGRDQYIAKDCGGFYQSGSGLNPFNFKNCLRGYDTKPTKIIANDFSVLSRSHMPNAVKAMLAKEGKKQRILSARLSAPKKINPKFNNVQ